MTSSALASRLPRIDPARAVLQTRLLAALDGRRSGDVRLSASVSATDAPAVIAFDTHAGGVEIAPLVADGTVPLLVADDGRPDAVAAVAALASIEPLVAAIELALGVALRPLAVAAPALPLRLRVDAVAADGSIRHALLLNVAADGRFDPAPCMLDDARASAVRARWAVHLAGPRLAPWQVAAIDPGDLVLVGQREFAGAIHVAGRAIAARFRADTATLTVADQQGPMMTDTPSLDADMRLPVTVVVDGGTATLGEITRLAPGSVLPLGIAGATLPVTLTVGGEAVAAGELVAVGDAYGVLVTRRIGG